MKRTFLIECPHSYDEGEHVLMRLVDVILIPEKVIACLTEEALARMPRSQYKLPEEV
jgi:hypothetical protein